LSHPSTAIDPLTKYLRNPLMGRRRPGCVVYLRGPLASHGVAELNFDDLRHPSIIAKNLNGETPEVLEAALSAIVDVDAFHVGLLRFLGTSADLKEMRGRAT